MANDECFGCAGQVKERKEERKREDTKTKAYTGSRMTIRTSWARIESTCLNERE